jgi:vacuolar protein sorting-associated protein 8
MGCDSMDKTAQIDGSGFLRSGKAELWAANMFSYLDKHCDWNLQRHCLAFRLSTECKGHHRLRNERWVGIEVTFGKSWLTPLAIECGPVTSLAISEDSTTIAVGHAEGHIFTWELAKPTRPFLHIPPLDAHPAQNRKSDGHLAGVPVVHIGFLGFRHTALVSADNRGMAFSHLATRGLGSVGRAVRTTRVLGRYPDILQREQAVRKPSSVLAFSPLPFGNVEQATNTLGLVAMMTPYLLVIVSTTPIAQTQHKAARPKEIAAHSAMTAALAWFPALKLKSQDTTVSNTKLVYCWSNVLTVLEVLEVEQSEPAEKEKPLELSFKARSRWRSQEAIVAVQWLSRSVMAVLTITQQLVILEDVSMNASDSLDLVQRQIYHHDFFSQQLLRLVEQLDEEDSSMHGVVADAFYMSFRAYKGRLFVLGVNEVSIGSISNWADRLLAMLEAGDFIGAIRLATSYYSGLGDRSTIGLPDDDQSRHGLVREKLLEIMSASLKYSFGHNQQAGTGQLDDLQLKDLAIACVYATLAIEDTPLLFDEVFAWYDDHEKATIFLDVLEPYILDGQITSIPPVALKPLINHYMTIHTSESLEETICRLDTSTMDIDQVTSLCKSHNLYDAYIYVWTQALGDYTGPLEELLKLSRASSQRNGHLEDPVRAQRTAIKIFPYLSFTLTSRIYPTGKEADPRESHKAKEQIYGFFFSGALDHVSRRPSGTKSSQTFSHLRELLSFDAASSMSVLNEAFEDNYLNRSDEASNGFDMDAGLTETSRSKTFTRQFIVAVLLEVMSSADLKAEDSIFIDMFVARSLPKYPQDIVLSGSTLDQVLTRICYSKDQNTTEDCQLSVEYLLSVYHPPDMQSFLPLFKEARFFRVLKSVFRSEHQWSLLVQTYFLDQEDQEEVFEVIRGCLRNTSPLSSKQRREIQDIVKSHAINLANVDVRQTALLIAEFLPESHELFLSSFENNPNLQYHYLNSLLEPPGRLPLLPSPSSSLIGRYIQLLCQRRPLHVASYVDTLKDADLQLRDVLPSMEASGVIDAAVILMARQGQVGDAMKRLVKHLSSLEGALSGILLNMEGSPDVASSREAINDLLGSITRYSGVGTWLCQRQTKAAQRSRPVNRPPRRPNTAPQILSFEETLWLQLISSIVSIATNFSRPDLVKRAETDIYLDEGNVVVSSLRTVVQNVFTALLKATTASRETSGDRQDFSFLQILRAFLTRAAASSPSLAELRAVISSIFSAYAYEESLLALSNAMLDKDLFVHVDEITKLRSQGWRPRGQICEICRHRVWGPGAGAQIWEAWLRRDEQKLQQRQDGEHIAMEEASASRGKGKAIEGSPHTTAASPSETVHGAERTTKVNLGPVIVFACRHLFHQTCLDHQSGLVSGDTAIQAQERLERWCPTCPRT